MEQKDNENYVLRVYVVLAMAYAAASDFPQAIEITDEAISLCENTKKNELAYEIKKRLQLYKAGQPYRGQ